MSGAVAVWTIDTSPSRRARINGFLYLLTIATGLFAEGYVSGQLVTGDAATTAANILAHKGLYQAGFGAYMVEMACNVMTTALFYDLLKPVSGTVSLIAAFLGLVGCTIKTVGRLFFIAPLLILGGGRGVSGLSVEQLQAQAMIFLKINDRAAEMALFFFGFYTLLTSWLILRSTFLPRIFGVLGLVGGLGWLTFVYPPLAHRLFLYTLAVALPGAVGLALWLLVKGVNVARWEEQARAAAAARGA